MMHALKLLSHVARKCSQSYRAPCTFYLQTKSTARPSLMKRKYTTEPADVFQKAVIPNQKKMEFRLTTRGINIDNTAARTWKFGETEVTAPFYGQESAALDLLESLWKQASNEEENVYPVIVKEPGGGTSRFLSDWIVKVFQHPAIQKEFFSLRAERSQRKKFLDQLYSSLYGQYTLLIDGGSIKGPIDESFRTKLLKSNILARFAGTSVKLETSTYPSKMFNGDFVVTEQYLNTLDNVKLELLFIGLCDFVTKKVRAEQAFNDTSYETAYITFLIDNCHNIGKDSPCDTTLNITQIFNQLRFRDHMGGRCYRMSNRDVYSLVVFAGSHMIADSMVTADNCKFITVEHLLDHRHLPELCEELFKHRWSHSRSDTASKSLPELEYGISIFLQRSYLMTAGDPTALKKFMESSYHTINTVIKMFNKSPERQAEKKLEELAKSVSRILREHWTSNNNELSAVPQNIMEQFNVQMAFMTPVHPNDRVPGTDITMRQLLTSKNLILWQYEKDRMTVTRPFFAWSKEELTKPLAMCASRIPEKRLLPISLASLILCEESDVNKAVAASIYTRYCLQRAHNPNATVKLSDLINYPFAKDSLFVEATVELDGLLQDSFSHAHFKCEGTLITFEEGWKDNTMHIPVKIGQEALILRIACWTDPKVRIATLLRVLHKYERRRKVRTLFIGTSTVVPESKMLSSDQSRELPNAALVPLSAFLSPLCLKSLDFETDTFYY